MKRLFLAALAIAGMLCFSIPFAEAAIDNTSHDQTAGPQGACSTCHIPHKSYGKRLWPVSMSGQESDYGVVGALCFYCHGTGGGGGFPNAVQNNIMGSITGQATYSHGLSTADIPGGGNGLSGATDLPYYNQSTIQCTSCHDVHSDVNRPFLRRSYETLCQDCHTARSTDRTFPDWSTLAVGDNNTVGSHPIGGNITGDVSGYTSPINFNLTPYINTARSAAADNWVLGGHLSATSGVMCGSCHAPHGVDLDAEPAVSALWATNDQLVFSQGTAGATEDGGASNGNGMANNALCESCHYNTTATWDSGTGAAWTPTSWTVAQGGSVDGTTYEMEPNPGGSAYTHPVDTMGAAGDANVSAFPTGWPTGSGPSGNVNPKPICESCHTPHPAANDSARAAISAGTGTPILRDTAINLCGRCHGTSWANHHPAGAAGNALMTARFDETSSVTVDDGRIGNGDDDLTCSDCHGGSGGGAHNWGGPGVGLDRDWVPANNARGAGDTVGGTNLPDNAANMSDSCKQCHMNTQGGTAHQSPTKNAADAGAAVTHSWRTNTGYTDLGEGTHYLGDNVTGLYSVGYFGGGSFNATTQVWDNTTGTGKNGWSRWYGQVGSVGCQSCHELEPSKNVTGTALLLAWYKDGDTEANNSGNDPSAFCEGCHGQNPGGGTPHPMTGDAIGRAVTAGRATTTLLTTVGPTVYLGTGAPSRTPTGGTAGTTTFPGTDLMSCDSCHQPHDAATVGGTYIYESSTANVTGTAGTFSTTTYMPVRGGASTIEDRAFCNQCHNY